MPTFSQVLGDAGYFLGYVGKWHVHPKKGALEYGFHLAADPAYRDELTRLRHRLVGWMEEIHDSLLNQWTRMQLLEGLKV